jgi:hypothetical protein
VLLHVLEGLHEAESLIHAAADGSVIVGSLDKHALGVDDEEPAISVAGLLNQHAIFARNGLGQIGHERNVESATKAALLAGRVDPGQVRVLGINRNAHELTEASEVRSDRKTKLRLNSVLAYVLSLRNSSARSLKAKISVGHTNVKSRG